MRLPIAAVILWAASASSAPSVISLYSVDLEQRGDTLFQTVEIQGVRGSDRGLGRFAQNFDPLYQSVVLLASEFGFPGTQFRQVPPWAVDTLTGSGEWPLSLVTAFPGLREGMEIRYRVLVKDWSDDWIQGPWAVLSSTVMGIEADSCVFTVSGDRTDGLRWSGTGYSGNDRGDGLVLTSGDSSGLLWISPFTSYEELSDFVLDRAEEVLGIERPLDLREAALQASAVGADEWYQVRAARSLVCNSLGLTAGRGSGYDYRVRDLQDILDTRTGTALELAVLFTSMCQELGISAVILPASEITPELPVPYQWNRFLVRVESADGRLWLVEPSAYLTEAFYIYRPVTLYILQHDDITALVSNPAGENSMDEEWDIDANSGTFNLRVRCRGWFDGILRSRFAGLSADAMILAFSEWSWRSGRLLGIDSIEVSDPYDLGTPASISVSGRWSLPSVGRMYCDHLPVIFWNEPDNLNGNVNRTWRINGVDSVTVPDGIGVLRSMGSLLLSDTSMNAVPVPVLLDPQR